MTRSKNYIYYNLSIQLKSIIYHNANLKVNNICKYI